MIFSRLSWGHLLTLSRLPVEGIMAPHQFYGQNDLFSSSPWLNVGFISCRNGIMALPAIKKSEGLGSRRTTVSPWQNLDKVEKSMGLIYCIFSKYMTLQSVFIKFIQNLLTTEQNLSESLTGHAELGKWWPLLLGHYLWSQIMPWASETKMNSSQWKHSTNIPWRQKKKKHGRYIAKSK